MTNVNRENTANSSSSSPTQAFRQPVPICFPNFATSQQATLFQALKDQQFSGQLCLEDGHGQKSQIHLYLGRIIYATGGIHPVRRWRRTVMQYCPQIEAMGFKAVAIQQDIAIALRRYHPLGWDYEVLCRWFKQQKINRDQLLAIIFSLASEVLFDLMQSDSIVCQFERNKRFNAPVVFLDAERIIVETWKSWQGWHRSCLGDYSPNEAPIIKSLEQLKKRTNSQTYRVLVKSLDGKRSLRDLAIHMNQDLLQLVSSLMLYIHLGFVELVKIEDLPQPLVLSPTVSSSVVPDKLIVCVDAHPQVSHLIKKTAQAVGYQFLGINDAFQAVPLLVAHQPDLIFIDWEMPGIDGWRICSHLRQLPLIQEVPIVILVNNQKILERLQAKIIGSCVAILSKPLNSEQLLEIINQYLPQKTAA